MGIWANNVTSHILAELDNRQNVAVLDTKQEELLLKIEDPRFYEHFGVDISNGQGLTTITSSIARDLFLSSKNLTGINASMQSFYRYVFECCKKIDLGRDVMAIVLDNKLPKKHQLNYFSSNSYMGSYKGRQIKGFSEAAEAYFEKPLNALTDEEFIGLVSVLISPNYYHPKRNPERHQQRLRRVKKIISGECTPNGWLDVSYLDCHIAGSKS
ncbi:transglycosylase domain-containing protein [Pseudobacteriovorax antillogorgiicola]|uniref:transglycosylase domain-containing protein n=1 Tax=Pseudobacteriovorax antillogorgiicola TaxID=1513793 RepID=UPI002E11609D